jgi:hypothetical protein
VSSLQKELIAAPNNSSATVTGSAVDPDRIRFQ